MKNGIIISFLTAITTYFYMSESATLKTLATIIVLLAILYLSLKQIIVYSFYKSKITNFDENNEKPFVNVNKVSWKILALVPNIDKMTAKHIVYNRRHFGNYKNFEVFFEINKIAEEKREQIKKYIIIA